MLRALGILALIGITPLSAQAPLEAITLTEMALSQALLWVIQCFLLAAGASVGLVGVACCIAWARSTAARGRTRLTPLLVLVTGLSIWCSSCGVMQQVQTASNRPAPTPPAQAIHPHYHAHQGNPAFINLYKMIGYPPYRTAFCQVCGQRIISKQD